MEKIYLHNFTKTGKEAGFDLKCYIINCLKDCGVEVSCPCNDCAGCFPCVNCDKTDPVPAKTSNDQLQKSIIGVLTYVQRLEEKIKTLETELDATKEYINCQ